MTDKQCDFSSTQESTGTLTRRAVVQSGVVGLGLGGLISGVPERGAAANNNQNAESVSELTSETQAQSLDEFIQQQKLAADDGNSNDWFGDSISLSSDGTTALIGAQQDAEPNGEFAGSAYVFTRSTGQWVQQQKLTPDDGDGGDRFGHRVSLSSDGTTALIGAHRDEDPNARASGSAYVFTRSNGQWTQQQKLASDDGDTFSLFGSSVSLSSDGTTALIGARYDSGSGSAYVFSESNGQWTQQQKITPGGSDNDDSRDNFGGSVSLSNDGTTAIIGAYNDGDVNGTESGSAYVFVQNNGEWTQQQKISANDGDSGDIFGIDVALSADGTSAVIGAARDEDPNGEAAGSAYAFASQNGQWTQQQKLTTSDGDDWDRFGTRLSLSSDGTTALIDAHTNEDPNGESAGSAYVFTHNGGEWTQQQRLAANDGDSEDKFGLDVSLSNDGTTALIGARKDEDPNGQAAGSAYAFSRVDEGGGDGVTVTGDSPATDTTGDGKLNDIDGDGEFTISDVQDLFNNRESEAIQTNPDQFDFNDSGGSPNIADVQALFNQL